MEGGERMRECEQIVRRERDRDVCKNAGSSCSSCYGTEYILALYDGLVRGLGLFLRCKIKQSHKSQPYPRFMAQALSYMRLERHKVNNSGADSSSIEFSILCFQNSTHLWRHIKPLYQR